MPPCQQTVQLLAVLPPLSTALTGLIVRCDTMEQLERVIHWKEEADDVRRSFPVALVLDRDPELLRRVATCGSSMTAIVFLDELVADGRVPPQVTDRLWGAGLVAALLADLLSVVRVADESRGMLKIVVEAGVAGRNVSSLCRALKISDSTLRRLVREQGLPSPKPLLAVLRVCAVERAVREGIPAISAVRSAGWTDRSAFRAASRRVRIAVADESWAAPLLRRIDVDSGATPPPEGRDGLPEIPQTA